MTLEERKERLKQLVEHLTKKYGLDDNCSTHKTFDISPKDVEEIVIHYKDLLEDSNIFISPTTNSHSGFSFSKFKVECTDNFLTVGSSGQYDRLNHFESTVRINDTSRIRLDVSCETILSLEFFYHFTKKCDMYSFRKD